MDLYLKNRRVFITGSSRGIGLATAECFLSEGAVVILNGRDKQRLALDMEIVYLILLRMFLAMKGFMR